MEQVRAPSRRGVWVLARVPFQHDALVPAMVRVPFRHDALVHMSSLRDDDEHDVRDTARE